MNTQSHVIMGALLFGRPLPRLAWAGAAGGVVPDLPMYVMITGYRAQGYSLDVIFNELYWNRSWQIANGLGHNLPLWGALAIISALVLAARQQPEFTGGGLSALRRLYAEGSRLAMMLALSLSALIHSLIDLAFHRNDGHMHFWPFTDWRFVSPISYWDPAHYGVQFALFETALGLVMALFLFRRYTNRGLRLVLAIAMLLYLAVPVFFFFNHHGT